MRFIPFLLLLLMTFGANAQYLADNHRPDPTSELFKSGERAYRSGEFETAILLFSRVIEIDEDHSNAHLQRGFCYSMRKEYQDAIDDFTAVIEMKPDHAWAYMSRGSALAKLGRQDEARADFDKVLDLDPGNAEALNNRGWTRKAQGDIEGACEDWKSSKRMGNAEARIILQNNRCK